MVLVGILLMGLGVVFILAAVFVSGGSAMLLGIDMSALTIFLVGVAAGAGILWGYSLAKLGTKREIRQRKERKELNRLSRKLDEVESDRRKESEPPVA